MNLYFFKVTTETLRWILEYGPPGFLSGVGIGWVTNQLWGRR